MASRNLNCKFSINGVNDDILKKHDVLKPLKHASENNDVLLKLSSMMRVPAYKEKK